MNHGQRTELSLLNRHWLFLGRINIWGVFGDGALILQAAKHVAQILAASHHNDEGDKDKGRSSYNKICSPEVVPETHKGTMISSSFAEGQAKCSCAIFVLFACRMEMD